MVDYPTQFGYGAPSVDWLSTIKQALAGIMPRWDPSQAPLGGANPMQLGTPGTGYPTQYSAGLPSLPSWDPSRPAPTGPNPMQLGSNTGEPLTLPAPLTFGQMQTDLGTPPTTVSGVPSMPGFSGLPMPTPMNALTAASNIVSPVPALMQEMDRLSSGPTPADAAPAVAGQPLPPLSFEAMRRELGMDADPSGLSVNMNLDAMPRPPQLAPPPAMGIPAAPEGYDKDQMQGIIRNSILSGLAGGAASVDATSAGAFAKALAATGAGGAQAAAKSGGYKLEADERQKDKEYEHEFKANEIAFRNATNAYNTTMKNAENIYNYETKKWELTRPQIKATKDSILVQEYKDGKMSVRAIPTDGPMGDAKNLNETIKAIGGSGPVAEAAEVQFLSNMYKDDPAALHAVLTRTAIERTLENGGGAAVFGDTYNTALDQAKKNTVQFVGSKDYAKLLQKELAGILLSNPDVQSSDDWLTSASKYGSFAASVLKNGQ